MKQIFEKINELFDEYLKTLNLENTENARLAIEEKIILTVWKANKNYREYSVEVVKVVKACLKSFSEKADARKNEGKFSNYLFGSLKKSIGTTKGKESLEQKTGLSISDEDHELIRTINKCIKSLLKMDPLLDENAIIGKVAVILKEDESEIRSLISLAKSASLELEIHNDEDDGTVLVEEIYGDMVDKNPIEDWFASLKALEKALLLIDSEWKKKPDQMLSELLTVFLLENGLKKEICAHSFLNKEILNDYFKNHKLTERQKIAEKYGLTKSAASKILSRFLEKIREK